MARFLTRAAVAASLLIPLALLNADDKEDAIKKDRKLLEGVWKVVSLEVNGDKTDIDETRKMTVVNGADDSWSFRTEGNVVASGTNVLDPTKSPKTIDLIVIDGGKKDVYQGIYEISEKTRRLCFVPIGVERPTDFTSTSGSQRFLVAFEKLPAK